MTEHAGPPRGPGTDGGPRIETGYVPGVVGRLTALHATDDGTLWELGPRFEADVADGLAGFVRRYDPATDGLWTVVDGAGAVRGGIVVDGRAAGERGAQLRYVLLDPALRGEGLGRALLSRAMAFCEARDVDRISRWTVDELDAAIHRYRDVGVEPTGETDRHTDWGTDVPSRCFAYRPDGGP